MARSAHVRRLESRVTRTAARFVTEAARSGAVVADLPTLKLPWYEIRNTAADQGDETSEVPTVFIFDEIGGSFGVDAKQFAEDLDAIDAPAITVRINSPGGSLFDAIAIYNALNHHPAQITVYVDALAASAASIVAMAGDEIVMMPGSQMMIHDALATEEGNSADMAKMSTFLDRQSNNIADIYRMRAGADVATWRGLMLAETWMFADEAVELRLADRAEEPTPASTPATPDLADRMTRAFDLSQFQYAGRAAAPPPDRRKAVVTVSAHRATRTTGPAVVGEHGPELVQLSHRLVAGRSARAKSSGIEHRAYPVRLEVRSSTSGGSTVVEGYASVTESPYEMWDEYGPYTEVIRSGAFARTLNANPQVQLLLNHGGLSMAYTRAGTLQLSEDSTGLHMRAEVNPARRDVSDMLAALDDGNVDEMSFAFRVPDGRSIWSPDYDQRDITEVDMNRGDVSVVNFGANPGTSVTALRALDLDRMDDTGARQLFERLGQRFTSVPDLGRLNRQETTGPVTEPVETQPATPVIANESATTQRLALSLREIAADDDAASRQPAAV